MIARADEKADLKEAGKRLGEALARVADATRAGISTQELDTLAEKLIREGGDVPAFKGYRVERGRTPYPATCCISVNDEVVHGLPGTRVIQEGDIVSLDLGLAHKGYIMDSAITIPVGKVSAEAQKLMVATQVALEAAIKAARPGARVGDISHATELAFKGSNFSVVKALGGHGVGKHVHEEPFIANAGHPGTGSEIVAGMVLALEPIANLGKAAVLLAPDGFTYRTRDGSLSAHFEHTILVDDNETIVLTRRPNEKP